MSTPWKLYNEVSMNNEDKFAVYRCPDPVAVKTGAPWYSYSNVCPCDPKLSNQSGRGFTACPLGVGESEPAWDLSNFQLESQLPVNKQVVGNLYNQSQFVPPQLQPRPLARIGETWRSAN